MSRWIKRVTKERADDLKGEKVIAATYWQTLGSAAAQIQVGMTATSGNTVQKELSAERAVEALASGQARQNIFEGSIAATFPETFGVLAVTDKHLIPFGYSQGAFRTRIEDPTGHIPRERLAGWVWKPGMLLASFTFLFDDGSCRIVEVPRANRPADFAAALGIPKAAKG
jgi:hypothetical protein